MYINEREQTILARIAFFGPAAVGKGDMLRALYDHFAAQNGPGTHFQVKDFEPHDSLVATLGESEAAAHKRTVEETFGAPYEDIAAAGSLLWLRVTFEATPRQYKRAVDVFSVGGEGPQHALRDYTLKGADCAVFVADDRPERHDATLEMWERLKASHSGPRVLLVNHTTDAETWCETLGFEGAAFAENGGFDEILAAFMAASTVATRAFAAVN